MKAVIIDTFNNYDIRIKYVYNHLINSGYQTTIITSDFCHGSKEKIEIDRENTIAIDTIPYKKNLSFERIKSHLNFSKQTYSLIKKLSPDLIYCVLPLNSLAKKVRKYANGKEVKVFFDIFDLWPESLPAGNFVKNALFPWRNMRNKHLKCASTVFLECSYYKQFLPDNTNYKVAYLCKDKREVSYSFDSESLNFLYLGSINNIIDIDNIICFLASVQLKRKVHLHIIGGGESEKELLDKLSGKDIPHTFWGRVYDEKKKDEIISSCQFGINMYKSGLCIGLTMKSLEYFCRGLPLINCNIYDTFEIINENGCGINLMQRFDQAVDKLTSLTYEDWLNMHENCLFAYDKYFLPSRFNEILKII